MTTQSLPIDAYYDSARKTYLVVDNDGDWMCVDREGIKLRLAMSGYRGKAKAPELISPADTVVVRIQQERNVSYAGPLAGFERGVKTINGVKVLVTHSPRLITPVPGNWDMLKIVIDNQFVPHEGSPVDQRAYWHAWLKLALAALRNCLVTGRVTYGQILILVGKKGCGKSLLQKMITKVLGGRVGYPYQFMSGQTPFNRELFANEHQAIEDENEHKDYKNRAKFGGALKQIASKTEHPCYGKNRDGQTLTPFWRCSVSSNDEPAHLEVLPPFGESLQDKVVMLHCRKLPMPMPTGTAEEKQAFEDVLLAELPAYLHWLEHEFVIPAEIADPSRYGVKAFFHPGVMMLLNDLLPETRLLALIDHTVFFSGVAEWKGTAEELIKALFESDGYSTQARALLGTSGMAGRLLSQLGQSHPERVKEHRTATRREWHIKSNGTGTILPAILPMPDVPYDPDLSGVIPDSL